MKKILFLFVSILVCVIANAETDKGVYEAKEYGKVVARIELKGDGTAIITDVEYNETKYVTYNIDGPIYPGNNWTIEFYEGGRTYQGHWMWAIEDGKAISFDGLFFERKIR